MLVVGLKKSKNNYLPKFWKNLLSISTCRSMIWYETLDKCNFSIWCVKLIWRILITWKSFPFEKSFLTISLRFQLMENEIKKRKKVQKYPNQFALLLRNLKSDSDSNIKPLWKARLPKILENIILHFQLKNKENNVYIFQLKIKANS